MHEIRLCEPAYVDKHCIEEQSPYDLLDPNYIFERRLHVAQEGRWLANEVGSVHQSFTEDEDCFMIAVWPGKYVIFNDDQLPRDVFVPVSHRSQATELQQRFPNETRQLEPACT